MPKVSSKDGTSIAFDKKGHGPLLILVLGALNKRGSGKKLADLLKDKFTVISYNRRGRGDSTDTQPYSVDKEVEDLEALIEANGGTAYLYGHSSGSVLALLTAKVLSSKVAKLALYELPHNDEPEAQKSTQTYRTNLKSLLDGGKNGDAVALFVKSVGVTDKQIAAMKKLPMWKGLTAMAPTLAYDTIELMEKYPKLDIKDIQTPALVMYGAASPAFMAHTAQNLAQALPNAESKELEGQHHDVKADVLAPVLSEFFQTAREHRA